MTQHFTGSDSSNAPRGPVWSMQKGLFFAFCAIRSPFARTQWAVRRRAVRYADDNGQALAGATCKGRPWKSRMWETNPGPKGCDCEASTMQKDGISICSKATCKRLLAYLHSVAVFHQVCLSIVPSCSLCRRPLERSARSFPVRASGVQPSAGQAQLTHWYFWRGKGCGETTESARPGLTPNVYQRGAIAKKT